MPHKTSWEQEGIYWCCDNIVTFEEANEIINELLGNARFDSLKYFILDATDIKQLDITKTEVDIFSAITSSTRSYKSVLKCAFVSEDKSVRMLIDRYIETSTKLGITWEFKIFNHIKEARKWIASFDTFQ